MTPIVTWLEKRFVCLCLLAQHGTPQRAGFLWDARRRQWWTREPEVAEQLRQYWDQSVHDVFAIIEERRRIIQESRAVDADIDIPAPPDCVYKPYQKAGIAVMSRRPNNLLGDDMGLGKTIQAIGMINYHAETRNVLIVCPASLKLNWRNELAAWLVNRDLRVGIAEGRHWPEANIVIINYDILSRHRHRVDKIEWDLLVVDEAHYIKNEDNVRTKAVIGGFVKVKEHGKRVARVWEPVKAKRKIYMTGTPIENRPMEIWSLIHSLDPENWPSREAFKRRYSPDPYDRTAQNMEELQRKLRATIMVRRLKDDVLTDLPPKMRQIIEIPATGDLEALIREQEARAGLTPERVAAIEAAVEKAQAHADKHGYRADVEGLREGMPVAFEELSRVRHETALAKVPYIADHVERCMESSKKLVLFAHHEDVLEGYWKLLAHKYQAVMFYGKHTMKARQEAVQRFQNDARCRLIILGLLPGGVGHTLTAASHVVFGEIDWVPGRITQAEDRCHRIGQRDSVLVQHLVLAESLDARIARTIVRKQEVIEQALDEGVAPAPKASPEPEPGPKPEIRRWQPMQPLPGDQASLF